MRPPDFYIGFGTSVTLTCARCGARKDAPLKPAKLPRFR
jgi:hypothetical protein